VGQAGTLDGTGSAAGDGSPLTYAWRQVGGGELRLDDPASAAPGFRAFRPGRADLELAVATPDGHVGVPDRVAVFRVTDANRPPLPEAAVVPFAWAGEAVVLDGSASSDPDGDPLAVTWVQTAGPPSLLGDAHAPVTTVVPSAWGELRFELVVSDGDVTASPVAISMRAASVDNQPPVADAGPDQVVSPGSHVFLDGGASHDPEGADLAWRWRQTVGPSVALYGMAGPTPGFVPDALGDYVFELVVADLLFESAPDEVRVTVAEAGPEPEPVAETVEAPLEAVDAAGDADGTPEATPETDPPPDAPAEPVPEPVTELAAEPGPEPVAEPAAERVPEPVAEVETSEPAPDVAEPEPFDPGTPGPDAGPDLAIPVDSFGLDAAPDASQSEPSGSGGGSSCAVGRVPSAPVLALLLLALLALPAARRRGR
jgi:MYXO-CTERM domain-containing protein